MAHEELRERSLRVWSTGDYAPTSAQLAPASVALVNALEIAAEHEVLDVAAGHGNCALAAARRGARATATDFSEAMVATGRQRTDAEGVPVDWRVADAADLPFPDAAFDRVTSTFGAIFAVDQVQVAAEIVRVLRPGGRAGITAWTPDGVMARMVKGRRAGPPPAADETDPADDAPDPFRWGDPDHVAALFAPTGARVATRPRILTFRYPTWDAWRHATAVHGLAVVARESMSPADYEQMMAETEADTAEIARADGDDEVVFDADYLEIVVTAA